MRCQTPLSPSILIVAALVTLGACNRANEALEVADSDNAVSDPASPFSYSREYVFLTSTPDGPMVVPFDFSARERGEKIDRSVRGWLARGPVWDRFLDESVETSAAGGVWRVVPTTDLSINVGGTAQIEAIDFDRGERHLRLELSSPLTEWQQGSETRFRLVQGRLTIGTEVVSGPVLELLRYERTLEDGWPPDQDFDALFLSAGDSTQMLLAETLSGDGQGGGYAWLRTPTAERTWDDGELRWLEVRAYQDARRDIPIRWSYRIPGAEVAGELESLGFDATLGPERGGQRAVEIHYTVSGWMEIGGERRDVVGIIRHTQQ